ncbi:MAG: hypothetical protein RQ899_02525 [Pseudomonadales bacterium]|nr:hypothetical protein [Pseudomonadales bacterium]
MKTIKTLFFALTLLLPLTTVSGEELAGLGYTRLYTDASGVSHFSEGLIPLDSVVLQEGARPAGIHNLVTDSRATLLMLEPGAFEDWHPSPDAQLLLVIQGISEVGVSDGEVRQFGPGSVLVMEDTGKGHTTRTVGSENHVAILIPLVGERGF